jgi:hypothetical protein
MEINGDILKSEVKILELNIMIKEKISAWICMLDDIWHGNLNKIEYNLMNKVDLRFGENKEAKAYAEELLYRLILLD